MTSSKPALLMALLSLTLAAGCTTAPRNEQPPVQVVETCAKPPPLPEELLKPLRTDYLERIERSLTNYFSLELKPTKQLGSAISPSVNTK
jgi:hypothetical protein